MSTYGNKNALKHGAFADATILPNEDRGEFEELRADIYEEWDPEGPTEREKVDSIVMNMWRKRRFRKHIQSGIAKAVLIDTEFERHDRNKYESLVRILEDIEAGTVTDEYLSKKLERSLADAIKEKHPRSKFESDSAWLFVVSREITAALGSPH